MNYIVLDLEWNQKITRGRSRALGEIVEFGAVKLNDEQKIVDTFSAVVRPSVYDTMHPHVQEIIHLDAEDLQSGMLFEEAIEKFLAFCGEEFVLLSWGVEDASILMQNLAWYGMDLSPASRHFDLQRIYRQQKEEEKGQSQRGLQWCVEHLGIEEQEGEYHSALTDARYAARIMQHLDMERAKKDNTGLFLPSAHQEKTYYDKFCDMAQTQEGPLSCPVCGKTTRVVADMFPFSGNTMIVIAYCKKDGYFSKIYSRRRGGQKKRPSSSRTRPENRAGKKETEAAETV